MRTATNRSPNAGNAINRVARKFSEQNMYMYLCSSDLKTNKWVLRSYTLIPAVVL